MKLTKKALNQFIGWTSSRYNDYMGYGTKKEAVETAFASLTNGHFTNVIFRKDKKTKVEQPVATKVVFELKCASPVGESGTQKKGSYWKTKQAGDDYVVDCKARTITAIHSKRTIKFI